MGGWAHHSHNKIGWVGFALGEHHLLAKGGDGEGGEFVPVRLVEFVLEFHPVETEGVEEAFEDVHAKNDGKGHAWSGVGGWVGG